MLLAKIYRAESAAAFISLSACDREMVRDGIFIIDLGSAEIDSGTLITEEKVPPQIIENAKKWRLAVFSALQKCGFPDKGTHMSKLIVQNRLVLTAEECRRFGIIGQII